MAAPHLVDIEVVSAWRRLAAAGVLDDRRVALAIEDLRALGITRVAHGPLVARCWQLRGNLTPYDAAYVALAELMDAPLLTADGRLASAPGAGCAVELLG
jgi:predicted nucleic acid-binding protein